MQKENKEIIRKELRELGSSLPGEGKPSGFDLPEGYFESLPGIITARRSDSSEKKKLLTLPAATPRQALAWAASLLLLVSLTISLFFVGSDSMNGHYPYEAAHEADFEYFSLRSDLDHKQIYDMVLETDLSAEEIMYGLEMDDVADAGDYDEMMEYLFEEASYYGIESDYLLSSLD